MNTLSIVGRTLFGLPFVGFGIVHFMAGSALAGAVPSWLPGGVFWVYLLGVALLAAGISIIAQWQIRLATLLLGVLMVIFVFTLHLPGIINAPDQQTAGMMQSNLLKDLAIAGAAFFLSGYYAKKEGN